MIDLKVLESGKVILNRDVKASEVITYQNEYLKGLGKTEKATVLMDLDKNSELVAGGNMDGKVVIKSDSENYGDVLIVKLVE